MPAFEDGLPVHAFGSRTLHPQTPPIRGSDVKVLQTLFNQLVAITHPPQGPIGQPIAADGVFGPQTESAVRQLQSYFGLTIDGVVGPDTYLVLGQAVGPHVSYGGPALGSRTLQTGSTGGDVRALQNRLGLFRYATALGGPADGIYGPRTGHAVVQFRADAQSNGDAGLGVLNLMGPFAFNALAIYTYAGSRDLGLGSAGLDVAFVQLLLATLTNPGTGRPFLSGPIDGYLGSETDDAIRTFQDSVGIASDGVVGPITFQQLGLRNPVAAPAPAPVPPIA